MMDDEKINAQEVLSEQADLLTSIRWGTKDSRLMLVLRGILLALIGLAFVFSPIASLRIVTTIIGIFIVIDALFVGYWSLGLNGRAKAFGVIYAILMLIMGVMTVAMPLLMDVVWIMFVGAWQLISGFNLVTAKYTTGNIGYMRFSGVLSILIGILFLIWPVLGLTSLLWVVGIFLMIGGIMLLVTGATMPKN